MDLGLFRRRRFVLWVWILCPVLLAGIIHYSVFFYCRRMAEQLQEQRAMAELVPDLAGGLELSAAVMDAFPLLRASASEIRSTFTTRISECSAAYGFQVNRVRISSLPDKGGLQKLEVTIDGEGGLLSIMKLLKELQAPEALLSLESARLRVGSYSPVTVYQCELVFEAGFVDPDLARSGGQS